MAEIEQGVLHLNYAFVDGLHFFVGSGPLAKGLCVAHADSKTAYDEVSVQLKYLLAKNHGIDDNPQPNMPYEDFLEWLKNAAQTPNENITPMPTAIIKWAKQASYETQ